MPKYAWSSRPIRALRRHLGLSQSEFGRELGVRQATVSEWETGLYQPRGSSAKLLSMIAERADFRYHESSAGELESERAGEAPLPLREGLEARGAEKAGAQGE